MQNMQIRDQLAAKKIVNCVFLMKSSIYNGRNFLKAHCQIICSL